jgi:hypothetical protein
MTIFAERAAKTREKLVGLAASLKQHLGNDAQRILRSDTCVYVVGSGGRGEMSAYSDVDLFVTRLGRDPSDVDALLVRQAIARALFDLELPEPSQGGDFLKMHTAVSLCERLGTPEDDAGNTFTARMLLLLESQLLLGDVAYDALLNTVLDAYWKDAATHSSDYQPFVLVNDIVRYWRILLLNYVAKNAEKERELEQPKREAERGLRSYKLRFSRCMTCFSVLTSLLAATAKGRVTKNDVLTIVKRTPVERLRALEGTADEDTDDRAAKLLVLYESFLTITAQQKGELVASFMDKDFASARVREGREFGDAVFDLLQALARDARSKELFRHMVV